MKICLVTTFPPSQGGLSEYGLHLANELQRNPFIRLTILADALASPQPELEGFAVERCWAFDNPGSPARILRAIHRSKADVVWFNLLFSTFGRNPLIAFAGLLTPVLSRLSGCYTHVTLHHLMDTVNLEDAGVRHPRAYRFAGALATRMLLLANSVSVLMPGYRDILQEKYGRENVHLRSHGILSQEPQFPDLSRRGNPEHRILAFGKWGTYKRLELMVEAFQYVSQALPNARLVVGGGNHPQAAGYVESMRQKYQDFPSIEFTGYVHEEQLPGLFQSSSVAVMPYSSSTGCSGVAHLACAYGVPIVCADLEDFRQMSDGEGMAIEFYKPGNARDLAECLVRFLTDSAKQKAMAEQNFSAALRMTMPNIVLKYLRHFEVEKKSMALRQIFRIRRLPNWLSSRPLLLRLMTRNPPEWVPRSALHRRALPNRERLFNDDVDGGRKLAGARASIDTDRVADRSRSNGRLRLGSAPARSSADPQADNGAKRDALQCTSSLPLIEEREACYSDGKYPGSPDGERPRSARRIHPGGDGDDADGEAGISPSTSGSDDGRIEGAA